MTLWMFIKTLLIAPIATFLALFDPFNPYFVDG